ncbi:MAG: hypothetical protein DI598_18540 [Pseudopedobacter saltans]|uniref:Fido domain-containing protein n=1 Tax=Pseudopedobacter saltans TaxID=151895 RepID=A0A2W5G6P6_9SPHI|nr:MAG: hypothetical protein DI598_18540 [Pseudopedobacter saltans]
MFDHIDNLEKEWRSLQPLESGAKKILDKKFRLEFNYNSNHLEGNTLTYGETELLLIFDDTMGNHTMREYEEMKAHDVAFQMVEESAKDKERPLTEQFIKNLNEILLVRPFWKDAITPNGDNTRRRISVGNYKEFPNSVRLANGEIFEYASPTDTPMEMQELIEWYNSEEGALYPVTLAAMLHYKFVRIHPFDDGNGRVSRLLLNYVLLRNGLPPVIIKSSDKANYLRVLHLADIGDYEPFIAYIAEQLEWSLNIAIKAAKGESIEEEGDIDKEISLLKKNLVGKNKQRAHIGTPNDILRILSVSGITLFEKLIKTLSQFDDLFHTAERRYIFSEKNSPSYDIQKRAGGRMVVETVDLKTWLEAHKEFNIQRFGMEFNWEGYKLLPPKLNFRVYVFFNFEKYFYSIERVTTYDGLDHYLENHYDDQLSMDDIRFTVNDISKTAIKYIEENHYDDNE